MTLKTHETLPVGTVVRIDASGEFGFLQAVDGQEIYFNRNSLLGTMSAVRLGGSRGQTSRLASLFRSGRLLL